MMTSNKKLKPIAKKTSIVEDVIAELSNFILSGVLEGTLKKGDKLLSERELAEALGVGRSTLREAMKVLTILGLLEVKTGQGTYITDGATDFYAAPLAWGLIIGDKSINELVEARSLLEGEAAFLAATRADNDELQELSGICQKMGQAMVNKDSQAYLESDVQFHMWIAKCAHNGVITKLLNTIRNLLELWIKKVLTDIDHIEKSFQEHIDVQVSLLNRDAEGAKKAMLIHIDSAAGMLSQELSKGGRSGQEWHTRKSH